VVCRSFGFPSYAAKFVEGSFEFGPGSVIVTGNWRDPYGEDVNYVAFVISDVCCKFRKNVQMFM